VVLPGFEIRGMGFGGPLLFASRGNAPLSAGRFLEARVASIPGGELAVRVLSSPTCLPDIFGGGVDTDADGVPDDRTATYTPANCTVYDTADGTSYLVRGVYRIRDTNDDRYGLQVDMTDFSVREFDGSDNSYQSVFYNLTETSHLTATGGSYHLLLDATGTSSDAFGPSARHIRYDIIGGFTPAGTVPVGGPLPDGTLTMSGDLDISTAADQGAARVKLVLRTIQPLIYDDGCPGVSSGRFEMRLNGSTTEGIHVAYSACHGNYEPIGAGVL
jgi:hypothetical protein